jgi:hypothetical protein
MERRLTGFRLAGRRHRPQGERKMRLGQIFEQQVPIVRVCAPNAAKQRGTRRADIAKQSACKTRPRSGPSNCIRRGFRKGSEARLPWGPPFSASAPVGGSGQGNLPHGSLWLDDRAVSLLHECIDKLRQLSIASGDDFDTRGDHDPVAAGNGVAVAVRPGRGRLVHPRRDTDEGRRQRRLPGHHARQVRAHCSEARRSLPMIMRRGGVRSRGAASTAAAPRGPMPTERSRPAGPMSPC